MRDEDPVEGIAVQRRQIADDGTVLTAHGDLRIAVLEQPRRSARGSASKSARPSKALMLTSQMLATLKTSTLDSRSISGQVPKPILIGASVAVVDTILGILVEVFRGRNGERQQTAS
ncbi:hypothetical protein [Micropruina sp.]|uniref:hypothetical protein n=1 Tax=Micropruina sp. TaxID=2737536 RepID=UPI0039E29768